MSHNNTASEIAVNRAEKLEEMDDFYNELEWLEVKVTASLDGTLRDIHVVTSAGGPHVEINLASSTVTCNWEESHTTHFNNQDLKEQMWNYFKEQWRHAEPEA